MRFAAITFTCMAVFAVAGPLSRPVAADDNAAHALANKFAVAAEKAEEAREAAEQAKKAREAQEAKEAEEAARKSEARRAARIAAEKAARRKAEAQRAADEADMLARARAEAEARRLANRKAFEERTRREAEQEKARIAAEQDKARIAAERARAEAEQEKARIAAEEEKARIAAEQERARAEAARLAQEADKQRAEDERRAEEARKTEAARLAREVEQQRRAEEAAAKAARRAKAARTAKEAEEKRIAQERAAQEKRIADEARAKLEKMRVEEARRIAEKFRLAREARERERGTRNSLGGPPPPPEMDEPAPWSIEKAPAHAGTIPSRVTVLLLMQPKRRGFSGTPGSANPVLCIGRSCYISAGPQTAAQRMSRWKALGPANSISRRAGPCRKQLACVFRNIDLGGVSGAIQPVDMGLLRHDRRDIKTVRADRTCDVIAGRLFCATPIIGHRYRAWVVPEAIAAKAGPRALEHALSEGLPAARSAEREDWLTNVHNVPTR